MYKVVTISFTSVTVAFKLPFEALTGHAHEADCGDQQEA